MFYFNINLLFSKYIPWHSVTPSPWPFSIRLCSFGFFCSSLLLFNYYNYLNIVICLLCFSVSIALWFQDVDSERLEGSHSYYVKEGLKIAIILFIISEVLFFRAWFWAFFHNSWSPNNFVGSIWPPFNIHRIDSYSIPILNTLLLLRSGICVTWVHNCFFNIKRILIPILSTLTLGILFTINQILEYAESSFTIADSFYGRSFFVTTGFHGIHVLLGSIFLLAVLLKTLNSNSSSLTHNLIIDFSIWYWHFVDVIWLFLIRFIYLIN